MDDVKLLNRSIEDHPFEPVPPLMLADALHERGEHLAAALVPIVVAGHRMRLAFAPMLEALRQLARSLPTPPGGGAADER